MSVIIKPEPSEYVVSRLPLSQLKRATARSPLSYAIGNTPAATCIDDPNATILSSNCNAIPLNSSIPRDVALKVTFPDVPNVLSTVPFGNSRNRANSFAWVTGEGGGEAAT